MPPLLLFKLHTFCYAFNQARNILYARMQSSFIHTRSHHRVLCLDRLDLQIVLDASSRAVGFEFLFNGPPRQLGSRLVLSVFLRRMGSRRKVTALFLGDVSFGPVDGFDVFPKRAGIGVALRAARDLTHVGFLRR